jgi:hypothetical protein
MGAPFTYGFTLLQLSLLVALQVDPYFMKIWPNIQGIYLIQHPILLPFLYLTFRQLIHLEDCTGTMLYVVGHSPTFSFPSNYLTRPIFVGHHDHRHDFTWSMDYPRCRSLATLGPLLFVHLQILSSLPFLHHVSSERKSQVIYLNSIVLLLFLPFYFIIPATLHPLRASKRGSSSFFTIWPCFQS